MFVPEAITDLILLTTKKAIVTVITNGHFKSGIAFPAFLEALKFSPQLFYCLDSLFHLHDSNIIIIVHSYLHDGWDNNDSIRQHDSISYFISYMDTDLPYKCCFNNAIAKSSMEQNVTLEQRQAKFSTSGAWWLCAWWFWCVWSGFIAWGSEWIQRCPQGEETAGIQCCAFINGNSRIFLLNSDHCDLTHIHCWCTFLKGISDWQFFPEILKSLGCNDVAKD